VDRVNDIGAQVHGTSLNVSHSSGNLWPGLNESKGYLSLLILAVDAGMDDPRRLGRQGRRARPTVVAHRSRPLPVLRSTKHDEVFIYGIEATRGTRLAHLGLMAGDDGGQRRRRPLLLSSGQCAMAPRVLWAPKSVSGSGNCSPNSRHLSIAARIGGRRRATTVARVLGLGVLRVNVWAI
jgi:hypothetical protein